MDTRSIPTLCFLLFLPAFSGYAQVVTVFDDFEDGTLSTGPEWVGDTDAFVVSNEPGNRLLQLDANAAGRSYLSTVSVAGYGSWEFFLRFDFATLSASNNLTVFLTSDIPDLTGEVNGYALSAGESGSDDVFELVRFDGGFESDPLLRGTTNVNQGGEYRVRVDRSSEGRWTLSVAHGRLGVPAMEAAGTDNTYTTSGYFGIVPEYTSSRSDKFFFDDLVITKLPIRLIKAEPMSNREIRLWFTDRIDPASVGRSDFSVDRGIGSPDAVSAEDNTATLTYSRNLPGGEYTVTATGISDLSGTSLPANSTAPFTLFDRFEVGDIIINEFMYDEPAGLAEYVELRNTATKRLDLTGWLLGDAHAPSPLSGSPLTIGPLEYLVIAADTTPLFERFGPARYLQMEDFPTLNNGSGDAVRILNSNGETVDSLFYTPDWGGEDVALERRSAVAAATFRENWGDSPAPSGGTPGLPNAVEPDRSAPELDGMKTVNALTLRLFFSEPVDSSSAVQVQAYRIAPEIYIERISAGRDSVTLHLKQKLQSGSGYEIIVSGIHDLFGNVLESAVVAFRYLEISAASAGDVVINEILFRGEPEFVELLNASTGNISLNGWRIGDESGSVLIPDGITMEPGSFLVLTGNEVWASSLSAGVYLPGFPTLNDTRDAVHIHTSAGLLIDSLNYSRDWADRAGQSAERRDPKAGSGDPSNWSASRSGQGHTPGTQNSVYRPDELPPELIYAAVHRHPDPAIEVRFNEFVSLGGETRFELAGRELDVIRFDPGRGDRVFLSLPGAAGAPLSPEMEIAVYYLSDLKGNMSAAAVIPVSMPLEPGVVVFNEILYNPLSDPDDNRPDQGEYVELINRSGSAVSLEGFVLHDAPDENGEVRILSPVRSVSRWIPTDGILLVYADTSASFKRSRTARYFGLDPEKGDPIQAVRIDRNSLGLASSDDAIYLADSSGVTIDSVFYDESWQNPNLTDTRGIALERIDPDGPGNIASNWSSSTTPKGGTPGFENSIYQVPSAEPERMGIAFSPNPFSPDGDGYEDHLFIRYKLDRPDYLLKVRIYDRYGRPVRSLADGVPSGFEGTLIWDGLTDSGTGNRIGIYIVTFEAYDSSGGTGRAFRELVVLARRM